MLRVVAIGTGFLLQSLLQGILHSSHQLVGVHHWTPNDGRDRRRRLKRWLMPSTFDAFLQHHRLDALPPHRLSTRACREAIRAVDPDVIVVGACGDIFGPKLLALPRLGTLNCHPSLLPAHRGPNPFASVILENESETGVSFHLMEEAIDAGPILLQERLTLSSSDTAGTVYTRCAIRAGKRIGEALDRLERGDSPIPQDPTRASYFAFHQERTIEWHLPASELDRQFRALHPYERMVAHLDGIPVPLHRARMIESPPESVRPGSLLSIHGAELLVSTGDRDTALLVEASDPAWHRNLRLRHRLGRVLRPGMHFD